MVDSTDIKCHFCGCVLELSKAVRVNLETGEYVYACENCALMWKKGKKGA